MRTVQTLLALALVAAPFTASATPDVKKDAPPATAPAAPAPATPAPARGPMAPVATKLATKHATSAKAAPHRHHAAIKRTTPAGK